MTEEQLVVLAAAVMQNFIDNPEEALIRARQLVFKYREMGPITPDPQVKKATLSKPTVEQWNQGYEERQYEKKRGS